MTHDWYWTLAAALAVYRAAVLVTADAILGRPRAALAARGGKLGEFVVCPWCVSMWLAAIVVIIEAVWGTPTWLLYVYLAASFSATSGLLSKLSD